MRSKNTNATLASLILVTVMTACSGGSGGGNSSPTRPTPITLLHPIDGHIDFSAFASVHTGSVALRDNLGSGAVSHNSTIRWVVTNDDRHLYFGIEWTDATENRSHDPNLGPIDFDGVKIFFDNNGDGTYAAGEDGRSVIAVSIASHYVDQHVSTGDETDAIADGRARLTYDSVQQHYQAEFLIPLADDANGEDGTFSTATTYNFLIFDHTRSASSQGNLGTLLPGSGPTATGWRTLELAPAVPHDYPTRPPLGGLIVFTSKHEVAKGEIYTYDPASGITTRVTNDPNTFKEGVSLSYDRTRITYHGAPSSTDYAAYEIYSIRVDGTGLTQLTNNSILDGHPGWSPDDREIAYASFRGPGGQTEIVVMTPTGAELRTLTPSGNDDNDPDYLPDGRIVFKTDRFSTQPEVRIAIMNADGSNPRLLTAIPGTSDHDPIGNTQITLFERFMKGTNYSTDPESLFSAWNLVEAQNDGSGERTLVSDGYINWLPVLDPTEKYIAYLKSVGYTEIRLMTRDGVDLGRLVPGITDAGYLDWK